MAIQKFKFLEIQDAILKIVKRDNSATVWPIFMKFGTVRHIDPPNPTGY